MASTPPPQTEPRTLHHSSEKRRQQQQDTCQEQASATEPLSADSGAAPEWDISQGPRKTGIKTLSMVVPAATRVATSTMGGLLATTGYAAGKIGETVGVGKAVDSRPFQAGFKSWMWSNGIFPTVVYEPLGAAGAELAALTSASGELKKEDMRITPFIVSNHTSYIDGLVLATVFQGPKIVAMAGTRKVPVIGKLMEEMEVVFVDRAQGDSKKATLEAIAAHSASWQTGSRPLLVFPEGTTTNGKMLTEFKKGAFVSGQPVRPVIIVYTGAFDPATTTYHRFNEADELHQTSDAEWLAQFMGHFVHSMHVRVLPPYIPSEAEQCDPNLYARGCKEYMDKELQRVRGELEACSWKAAAGRHNGGLGYKFGDISRIVAKKMHISLDGFSCTAPLFS